MSGRDVGTPKPSRSYALLPSGFFGFSVLSALASFSEKITRPFDGLLRIAVGQSVGAGCLDGGTLSIQIRHIPAGGRYRLGISSCFDSLDGAKLRTGT